MTRISLLLLLLGLSAASLRASDTLSVEQCRELALKNHPLQQRKAVAESIAALQLRNLRSNNLPRIALNGAATWQSDVFKLPIDNPLFAVPEIPKDQYKFTLDVSERIWDGGSDRYAERRYELERDLATAQSEVDMYQVQTLVSDLYAQALLLQESEAVLELTLQDLRRRAEQSAALVRQGVALRTSADQVQVQILKVEQQRDAVRADRQTLLQVLALWIGRPDTDFYLRMPKALSEPAANALRPEYALFELQRRQTQLGQDMLRLRKQPRIEAFAQGGLGRPNPMNFFETDFQPFAMIGLRASWTPFDWGNSRREKEVYTLQARQVGIQQDVFERLRTANQIKMAAESAKYQAMLRNDDAIIALQEDILRRADAQVQNGVMTMTDYLAQVDLLTQARLTRETHRIQSWQAAQKRALE